MNSYGLDSISSKYKVLDGGPVMAQVYSPQRDVNQFNEIFKKDNAHEVFRIVIANACLVECHRLQGSLLAVMNNFYLLFIT